MADSQRLVTNRGKLEVIYNDLINFVSNPGDSAGLYVFAANPNPWPGNEANVPAPDNTPATVVDIYNDMVFGKKVQPNQVFVMIPRYDWAANTVYAQYSDTDANLFSEPFYAVVNSTANYYVFKCLNNNNDSPSTEAPNFSDTSPVDTYYETSDGYLWKYMYTIDRATFQSIATSNFIPVTPDANVVANAVPGTIDVIDVGAGGSFYNNYYAGQFDFTTIEIGANPLVYGLGSDASTVNGFYTGCILTITEGTGKGQYANVESYRVLGSAKEVIIDQSFEITPDATSQYQLSPSINILGDGKQHINAIARALINAAASNSVYRIEVLNRGQGYRFAMATVNASPSAPVANQAVLQVIMPPQGGHGSDAATELGGHRVGITITFANTEGGTISTAGSFRTIGLLKNPMFANIELDVLNSSGNPGTNGTFLVTESVYQYLPYLPQHLTSTNGHVACTLGQTNVVGTNTQFTQAFSNGQYVFLTDGASNTFLTTVNAVANDTLLILNSNCTFSQTAVTIGTANIQAQGVVTNFAVSVLNITNATGTFVTGRNIIGGSSGSTANVNLIKVSGTVKDTRTFNQLSTYVGAVSGNVAFIPGETVYQPNNPLTTGIVHSVEANGAILYLDNEIGIFNVNATIQGNTSGATFNVASKYSGDLVPDQGEILYIENFGPISRSNTQSETAKIVLEL